jgi:hypothetical protein
MRIEVVIPSKFVGSAGCCWSITPPDFYQEVPAHGARTTGPFTPARVARTTLIACVHMHRHNLCGEVEKTFHQF